MQRVFNKLKVLNPSGSTYSSILGFRFYGWGFKVRVIARVSVRFRVIFIVKFCTEE